ncbi:MAG TPA: Rrf2 family transcriptional regulator [Methylococcaceae bacterium]|nr:Rrf2 family transcriptional regulator [Methylococcaceae bacterium]
MQLTLHTDYSLRVLIYLTQHPTATISELADYYQLSRNHLVKVVNALGKHGFIVTMRGKGGGVRLARDPREISVGEVVRRMETHFDVVECLRESYSHPACRALPFCGLRKAVQLATERFLADLDGYTLASVVPPSVTGKSP